MAMLEFRPAPGRFTDRLLRRERDRPPRSDSLAGLCVLVTDASSDIGRATATRLAARGARLVLVARRADQLIGVCGEITAAGGRARWHHCDLSALGDIDQLVDWVRGEFGAVDVLVANAGRPRGAPVAESLDRFRDYQRTMAANYFGPLRLTLGLLPAMLRSGSGLVVDVGPTPTDDDAAGSASYASSAAAWATFGRCVDAELAPHGIKVTSLRYPLTPASEPADLASTAARTAGSIEAAIRDRHRPSSATLRRTGHSRAG